MVNDLISIDKYLTHTKFNQKSKTSVKMKKQGSFLVKNEEGNPTGMLGLPVTMILHSLADQILQMGGHFG